jgi:hypothetical protein
VTTFLDLNQPTTLVRSPENGGGTEQGLLGLAFHPNYPATPYFYVYYTSVTVGTITNGTIVIARYQVSANPDIADSTSATIFLTVPHPTNTNHNGGMMAFGPDDGYLYIGMGDGGSGNDPPNNAQNINQYLGKIHRIDVNTPNGAIPYSSPPTNPFFGATPGLDEIYAYGIRNPWRFSFDRGGTHQLYLGDVGQGTREEIDIVVNGGNYGWRIMEGFICNPAFPPNCTPPSGYVPPIVDYPHINGRCSLTGGYVYRGAGGVFPNGAYIYGDYCTGEIFQLIGTTQTLLYNTSLDFNLSSFGEDEAGELYVASLAGAIYRLGSCSNSILPTSNSVSSDGGTNFMVALSAASSCAWTVASNDAWITVTSSANGIGNSTVTYNVGANTSTSPRNGSITIGNQTFTVNQAGTPTAVDLISFQAIADESGTTLKWQTGFEAHNLGFRLWRDDGGKRVAVNQQLIAGSALKTSAPLTSGDSYTWTDSATPGYQNASYWLEDVDLNGTSTWHGPFAVEKADGSRQKAESSGQSAVSRSAMLREINADDSTIGTSAVVERKAEPVKPKQAAQLVPAAVNLASAIKISIAHEGWYRISAADLFAAGLPQNADPRLLQLFVDGKEVPIILLCNKS